ncbi:hypothetical protein C2S53_003320 [Perilla frutescens var. hirtella]|uniref:Uncharacterized protein n=1 Tax=Perilla frutescens var. hirtella TaxID=608512 RepID=A0AAD4JH61_PERFH|nr:hypothetical protein C2S53_003320 [Perilla frutescens var. hirtella]
MSLIGKGRGYLANPIRVYQGSPSIDPKYTRELPSIDSYIDAQITCMCRGCLTVTPLVINITTARITVPAYPLIYVLYKARNMT